MEASAERLAAPGHPGHPEYPAGELLDLLLGGLDLAEAVVTAVPDELRRAPTPCPDLDVEHLVAHVVAGMTWFAGLPGGDPSAAVPEADPVLTGLPLGPAFASAARGVRRGWSVPAVEAVYPMPWGPADGREMAAFMAVEVIGHAWDLATASGQPRYPVDDLAQAALEVALELDEQTLRSPGMMGPPVDAGADAPAIDRFVAFLGRDPRWRPAG